MSPAPASGILRAVDAVEYLLFIPLLIYGIVLSQLLAQWRRLFDFANWHWPYIVTIVVFTEIAIWNIYTFLDVFAERPTHSYLSYLIDLTLPFTLLLSVNALVKDDNGDGLVDPEEFARRMGLSYFLCGCFIGLHLLPQFRIDEGLWQTQLPAIGVAFATAYFKKNWLVYLLGAIWVVSIVQRVGIPGWAGT